MRVIAQMLEDLISTLQPLAVESKDAVAQRVIEKVEALPVRSLYTEAD
jgi:hypothetical protein